MAHFLFLFRFKWPKPPIFFVYLRSIQTTLMCNMYYNKYMWKINHQVSCGGIQTHDLSNMSLLP